MRLPRLPDHVRMLLPQGRFALATPGLTLPYKIATVAVMALVSVGTLVTFGSAKAETPTTPVSGTTTQAMPGTIEVNPDVRTDATSLLPSQPILSTLDLTDYTPAALKAAKVADKKKTDDKKKTTGTGGTGDTSNNDTSNNDTSNNDTSNNDTSNNDTGTTKPKCALPGILC